MVQKHIQADITKATVVILKKGGLGVLVSDNLIMTAAHCIDCNCEGYMALGDYFIEEIKTAQEKVLKVSPLAVEPICDIAVLGSMDNQSFFDEARQFEVFCENTKSVPLCVSEIEPNEIFPVHTFTHKGTWVEGRAKYFSKNSPFLSIEYEEQIEGGTSGGPIINNYGELVGIVSTPSTVNGSDNFNGYAPRPNLTLPVWVYRQYFSQKFGY